MPGLDTSQDYYEAIKEKFAEARDLRLKYRPQGTAQYTSDLTDELAKYHVDPHVHDEAPREPITDTVEAPKPPSPSLAT